MKCQYEFREIRKLGPLIAPFVYVKRKAVNGIQRFRKGSKKDKDGT